MRTAMTPTSSDRHVARSHRSRSSSAKTLSTRIPSWVAPRAWARRDPRIGALVARRTEVTTTATIVSVTVRKLVLTMPNALRKRSLSGPDAMYAVVRDT